MKGEINRDWFCSGGFFLTKGRCAVDNGEPCEYHQINCPALHRKHPTPEQFREEYGVDYPDDGLVWRRWIYGDNEKGKWNPGAYSGVKKNDRYTKQIVCSSTPWGKPPDDWRPE